MKEFPFHIQLITAAFLAVSGFWTLLWVMALISPDAPRGNNFKEKISYAGFCILCICVGIGGFFLPNYFFGWMLEK